MNSGPASLWLVVIVAGALTFFTRLSFISLLANWAMPAFVQRALSLVPSAVLAAIVFPELLLRDGHVVASLSNYRLVAGVLAIFVAWRFRRVMPTIIVGMVALWLLQYFNG